MKEKKVLVALANHNLCQEMVSYICSHNWDAGTQFRLLYMTDDSSLEQATEILEGDHRSDVLLFSADKIAGQTGCSVSCSLGKGHTMQNILDQAREWEPDLLIVGSHGKPAVARWFSGSVSIAALSGTDCALTVLRPARVNGTFNPFVVAHHDESIPAAKAIINATRVLVAIEDPEQAEMLIDQLTHHHWKAGTCFEVVSVVDCSQTNDFEENHRGNSFEQMNLFAKAMVESAGQRLRRALPECTISEKVLLGKPAQELLSHAETWRADLLAAGSHGKQPAEIRYFGSISQALLSQSKCAVLLCRPARPADIKKEASAVQ